MISCRGAMKRFMVVAVIVALILTTVQGRWKDPSVTKKRQSSRQLLLCFGSFYLSLSGEERECLPAPTNLNSVAETPSLSMDMLAKLCSSEICINTIKRFLHECKSDFVAQLPPEYQDVNIESFFDLFCTNASDDTFCYSKLPLFNNSTADPIQSCQNVLSGEACSNDCQQVLQQYTSTCCFATYLELLPDQYGVQPTDLWSRCSVISPPICDAFNVSSAGTDSPVITDVPSEEPGSPSGPTVTDHPGTSGGNSNEPITGTDSPVITDVPSEEPGSPSGPPVTDHPGTSGGNSNEPITGTDSPVITDVPSEEPGSPSGPPVTDHPGTSGGNSNEPIKPGNYKDSSNSHSDDKGPTVIGVTVAAVMVTMILIVAVPATIVTLFLYFKRKRGIRRSSTTGSGDVMRMSLANNEDPDD